MFKGHGPTYYKANLVFFFNLAHSYGINSNTGNLQGNLAPLSIPIPVYLDSALLKHAVYPYLKAPPAA